MVGLKQTLAACFIVSLGNDVYLDEEEVKQAL